MDRWNESRSIIRSMEMIIHATNTIDRWKPYFLEIETPHFLNSHSIHLAVLKGNLFVEYSVIFNDQLKVMSHHLWRVERLSQN